MMMRMKDDDDDADEELYSSFKIHAKATCSIWLKTCNDTMINNI